jgi:hypothetical protein
LYSRAFGQTQDQQKTSDWHEQLEQPDWSENVLRKVPTRKRRLPVKQREMKEFDSIAEVAEES